jgi:thioredoxin 1
MIVTDDTFATEVLGSEKPVIVDFWAEWCGPCKMVAPVLEEIAAEHADKIRVVSVNVDENPEVSRQYMIMSLPTISVFVDGKLDNSLIGAKPKSALLRALERYL